MRQTLAAALSKAAGGLSRFTMAACADKCCLAGINKCTDGAFKPRCADEECR